MSVRKTFRTTTQKLCAFGRYTMKRQRNFAGVLALGLLLTLVVGVTLAQGPEPPEGEMQPQGALSVTGLVASTISYQGMLTEDGGPVDGSRNMIFRLYSDDSCSTQVGSDIDVGNVQVNDGFFDVDLDVDQDDFNGQGLWLEAEVDGTDIGCEEIQPVPYALSLRPGAVISDSTSYVELNRYVSGFPFSYKYGVYATSSGGTYGNAIYGRSEGTFGAGVVGSTDSATGWGVAGYNTAGGYAGYFSGDVGQRRTDDGLVKAAAKIDCSKASSSVEYSFNNIGDPITVSGSPTLDGICYIDFNFDLSDRYWSVTAATTSARGVSCNQGSSDDELVCHRWDQYGNGISGNIMVVVY